MITDDHIITFKRDLALVQNPVEADYADQDMLKWSYHSLPDDYEGSRVVRVPISDEHWAEICLRAKAIDMRPGEFVRYCLLSSFRTLVPGVVHRAEDLRPRSQKSLFQE